MKRKSTATNTLDSQLGRAMRKVLEQMEKSEERGEKSEGREAEDYRRGGKVRGPGTATSDSILARISNGEYILPKPAVDMVGANNLETIRMEALRRSGVEPGRVAPRDGAGRKKYLQGGAITGIGRYVAKNPEKALSMALGKAANIGTGYLGGLGMMANSQDAVAPTMDVTKEKAYQRAYGAVQAGKGGKANLREWNLTSNLIPPSNQEVLDSYNQQQAETDAMIRAQGGIAPSDRRALSELNRFNPRAYAPGYALGGLAFGGSGLNLQTPGEATATTFSPSTTVNPMTAGTAIGGGLRQSSAQPAGPLNQYGNDLSLTNRMNAGTDQLRAMRTGSATAAPTQQQPDFMTGLKSLLNPQQQAQDAYKAARGRADALDVASGRFDREYAPRFKNGGMVSQKQWEGLPRFRDGDWVGMSEAVRKAREDSGNNVPMLKPAVQSALQEFWQGLTAPPDTSRMPGSQLPRFDQPRNALVAPLQTASAPVGAGPSMGAAPRAPTVNMMTGKQYIPPAPPTFSGQGDPLAGRLPDVGGLTGYYPPQGPVPAPLPTTPGPGAGGYEKLPGTDIYRRDAGGTTTYTVPGEAGKGGGLGQATFQGTRQPGTYKLRDGNLVRVGDNPAGGSLGLVGTPETKGMTQAEATAYNVANLNRQYEALKSRNEAYGLGGSNVGSALPAAPAPVDIWARPGDSFGDSQMRQAQYESLLKNAGEQRGRGAKRRAAAMVDAAQALVAPGVALAKLNAEQAQEQARGLMGMKTAELQTQASERNKAIEAQRAQQAAEQAQKNWQAERDQSDRQKALDLAVRLYGQQARNQPRPAMLPEKAISDIMNRFAVPGLPGQPSTQDFGRFNAEYSAAPIPTDRSQMQAGQVYYDPSDPASPYKIATPQGMERLGGMRDLIIFRHMTNPAARGALPAGKADEEV